MSLLLCQPCQSNVNCSRKLAEFRKSLSAPLLLRFKEDEQNKLKQKQTKLTWLAGAGPLGWLGTSGGWFCSNHWGAPPCTICSLSHTRLMKAHSVHVTTKQPWRQSASRFCLWEGDMASIFKKHSDYLSNTISATNEILQPLQRNIWPSLTRYCDVGILEDCRAECLHWTKPVPHLLSVHGHVDGHIWRMKITHKFENKQRCSTVNREEKSSTAPHSRAN